MKKSKIVTLALVTSLAIFGCEKKKEKQPDEWSVQTDTENRETVQSYHSGSYITPFFWYWAMSRTGGGYGYYNSNFMNNRHATGARFFGSHSAGGGKSVKATSSHISRGGFGHFGGGKASS
jgi:uncharacterized lipoprotein NlpE involved in copper resistance